MGYKHKISTAPNY